MEDNCLCGNHCEECEDCGYPLCECECGYEDDNNSTDEPEW